MADTVQVLMEKMIPELEDLQEKKLFSKNEIHQIVERRRDFEYMMKRIPLRKIDALRYIEYELNLDALRLKRKERSGLQKASLSDTAGIKRVHSIFDRVIYKHRGSIDLWLQYIAFCKSEGSGRVLSHVFSRALQSHPRCPEIWIEAASYEFSTNLNIESARVLMQRAIRLNKSCQRLWHEYFRLELLYIQKLAVRREVLQLDSDDASARVDTGATVLLEELPEEKQLATNDSDDAASATAAATEKQRARSVILQGAIPRIIFRNAIASSCDDVAFRLEFIAISDLFGRTFASDLSQFILDSCVEDFASSERVHRVRALRAFVVEDDALVAEQCAVASFEASVAELQTVSMVEEFASWLVERLAATPSAYLVEYARAKLADLAAVSSANGVKLVDFVHRTEGTSAAIATVQRLLETPAHARAASLWLLYAQLVLHQPLADASPTTHAKPKRRRTSHDNSSKKAPPSVQSLVSESTAILDDALTSKLDADDFDGKLAVSTRLLELLIRSSHTSAKHIEAAFQTALAAQQINSEQWSAVRQQFLTWTVSAGQPLATVRARYKTFLEGQLLPTAATRAFLLLCVDAETSVVAADVDVAAVRLLFEKLVDLFGTPASDASAADDDDDAAADVWVAYIRFFSDRALFADAAQIHQRALRACKRSVRLAQLSLTGGGSSASF